MTPGSGTLGIQNMSAQGGIAGRGVLIDYGWYAARAGIEYNATQHHAITFEDLMAAIKHQEDSSGQQLQFLDGDILIIRTGYTQQYLKLNASAEEAAGKQPSPQACGLNQDVRTLKWLWDHHFSAVSGDSPAFEAFPPNPEAGFMFHEALLAGWGCPIGEMLQLEDLADWCRQNARWTFFIASSPLNVYGGVASPANAMAIM
jgi:kynurenine formamidase